MREKTWIFRLNYKQICLVVEKLCRVGIKIKIPESLEKSGFSGFLFAFWVHFMLFCFQWISMFRHFRFSMPADRLCYIRLQRLLPQKNLQISYPLVMCHQQFRRLLCFVQLSKKCLMSRFLIIWIRRLSNKKYFQNPLQNYKYYVNI